jgi:hypothetical protein
MQTDITARTWDIVSGPGSSESNCSRRELQVGFDSSKTALVVIDPWASHPNDGWAARASVTMPNLLQVIQKFRSAGRPIYYDSTGMPIHPMVLEGAGYFDHFIKWDPMGGGTEVLNNHLIQGGVSSIFWAGYSANLCLLTKPCGFRHAMPKDWSRQHFLVRDATIAFESADTLAQQTLWDAACYEVEYYPNGYSCTVAALNSANF